MKRAMSAVAAALLSIAFAAPASAGTVLQYDEGIHGDLTPASTVTELTLGAGHNTVKGQMHVVTHIELPDAPTDLDLDAMNLLLPAGLQITGMRVDFSFADTTQNTLNAAWAWMVTAWPANLSSSNCFVVLGSEPYCSGAVYSATGGELMGSLPTTEQRYLITQGSGMLWSDGLKPVGGTLTYTLSIDVAAVPEPATALLALLGLPLLGRAVRARRARGA